MDALTLEDKGEESKAMTSTIGAGLAVRQAVEGDLAEVLVLERGSATAPHWSPAEYRAIVGAGVAARHGVRRCLLVAGSGRVGEPLAGFAVGKAAGTQPDVDAEIESVVVRADERRQGLGTALCRAVMSWAAEEGARVVELEVRAHSAGAIRLYGGLGFVAVGRRAGYYERPADDGIVMRCTLGAPAVGLAAEPGLF